MDVWVARWPSNKNRRYHNVGNCFGENDSLTVTQEEAQAQGCTPCGICILPRKPRTKKSSIPTPQQIIDAMKE